MYTSHKARPSVSGVDSNHRALHPASIQTGPPVQMLRTPDKAVGLTTTYVVTVVLVEDNIVLSRALVIVRMTVTWLGMMVISAVEVVTAVVETVA